MGPIFVSGVQRLLDQQTSDARAIDEQLTRDFLSVGKLDLFDESVLPAQQDIDDLALDPAYSGTFCILAEVFGIEPRVELECVHQLVQREACIGSGPPKFPSRGSDRAHRPGGYIGKDAPLALAQIELVERNALQVLTKHSKRMEIAMTNLTPIHEFDAELVGALGRADELVLIDSEQVVE